MFLRINSLVVFQLNPHIVNIPILNNLTSKFSAIAEHTCSESRFNSPIIAYRKEERGVKNVGFLLFLRREHGLLDLFVR